MCIRDRDGHDRLTSFCVTVEVLGAVRLFLPRVKMANFNLFLLSLLLVAVQLLTPGLEHFVFIRQDELERKRFVLKIEDYVPEPLFAVL